MNTQAIEVFDLDVPESYETTLVAAQRTGIDGQWEVKILGVFCEHTQTEITWPLRVGELSDVYSKQAVNAVMLERLPGDDWTLGNQDSATGPYMYRREPSKKVVS